MNASIKILPRYGVAHQIRQPGGEQTNESTWPNVSPTRLTDEVERLLELVLAGVILHVLSDALRR